MLTSRRSRLVGVAGHHTDVQRRVGLKVALLHDAVANSNDSLHHSFRLQSSLFLLVPGIEARQPPLDGLHHERDVTRAWTHEFTASRKSSGV